MSLPKTTRHYTFTAAATYTIVILILLMAVIGFFVGSTFDSKTVTFASITYTSTAIAISWTTATVTSDIVATQTKTEFTVVTQIGPESINVAGTAKSNGVGTSATQITFVEVSSGNKTVNGAINNGRYSVTLPNHAFYNVRIGYTTPVGVGSGSCSAGGFVLFAGNFTSINANWDC
jgi:hypothetical protein